MRSLSGWVLAIASSAAIYALTLASADPIDLATGVVIGTGITFLLRSYMQVTAVSAASDQPSIAIRLLWFPIFLIAVLRDVVTGTVHVATYSVGLRRADRQGIVAIPIGDRSKSGVAVSAWATTISPGTALVDVDWEAGQMLLHVIDASDPDGIRAAHQHFYDRYQRRVFP